MKRTNGIKPALIALVSACIFACASVSHAYVVDGMVSDWGIDLSAATEKGYLDTHLPAGSNVDAATEDNADASWNTATWHGGWEVGPELSMGNTCDAEALYLDNDASNLYIALIQGLPLAGAASPAGWTPSYVYPGDIAIDADNDGYFEYALDVIDNSHASLVTGGTWESGLYSGTPYRMSGGTVVGVPLFAYSVEGLNGHYVTETSIPLNLLGLSASNDNGSSNVNIHWTMSCGNDSLTLKGDTDPVPEPSTMALMFTGFIGTLVPFARRKYNQLRRALEVAVSVFALILTAPVMLICAILIKLDSPGPVFYKQIRVGVNRRKRYGAPHDNSGRRKDDSLGKPFAIYKLRTMRADAEAKTGPVWAKQNDNRITRMGNFLRKTRLDEIPQFINVIKGEMSLIGPRPERPVFVKQLNRDIPHYYRRFDVKPGITGLAQVRYRYAASVEDTKKKLKYDLLYTRKICFFMDARIFFNTIKTMLFTEGSR